MGTEAGELFIADGTDLKATLDVPSPKEGIEAITPHGKVDYAAQKVPSCGLQFCGANDE